MAVVFGERDLDDDVAQYIEDIVRAQLCDMVSPMSPIAEQRGDAHVGQSDFNSCRLCKLVCSQQDEVPKRSQSRT